MAAANPTFRRLFPKQTFATDTPIETETMSFLATEISNGEEIYDSLGDAAAYAAIIDHHRLLANAVAASSGTVVKTIGERMLAAFSRREQAVEAALRIRQDVDDRQKLLIDLGIGIHCGPTLVATQNNQLDYFGSTVRAASKLPEFAEGDTLITEAVYSDSGVRYEYLQEQEQVETINLPGSPATRCKRIRTNRGSTE